MSSIPVDRIKVGFMFLWVQLSISCFRAYGLIRFSPRIHLVSFWKRSSFSFKYLFLLSQNVLTSHQQYLVLDQVSLPQT